MERISLNHWFIKENTLNISLMRFYVKIEMVDVGNEKVCALKVYDENREELLFRFNNLEEAIFFTENSISMAQNFYEIIDEYNEAYKSKIKTK